METKRTQLLNDALEMTKLVLQSTQANGEQLEKTDASLMGLGQDVTVLNQVAEGILEQEKEHSEVLNGIKDNQKVVHETNASLLETANSLTDVLDNNNEALVTIEDTLANGREQDKEANDAFLNELTKKNDSYAENVELLFNELTDTKQTLEDLRPHDELAVLLESVDTVATSIKVLDDNRETHRAELMEQFHKTEADIQTSIESLDNLTLHADQLVATFETAVSRIKTIELKINALSGDSEELEDTDALSDDSEELEEIDTLSGDSEELEDADEDIITETQKQDTEGE